MPESDWTDRTMYSEHWFDTFASNADDAATALDVAAIASLCPRAHFPRLLEIGCGNGRILAPLASRGYHMTGIDVNHGALHATRRRAPASQCVALDQQHVGRMRWTFDGVLVLWNSLGFRTRDDDGAMLAGVATVLRDGGQLVLDLYHPDWLRDHASTGVTDKRGATIDRWVEHDRCFNTIRYADGSVDDIQFNVYRPDEMRALLEGAGFAVQLEMTWWNASEAVSRGSARYQLLCRRQEV